MSVQNATYNPYMPWVRSTNCAFILTLDSTDNVIKMSVGL